MNSTLIAFAVFVLGGILGAIAASDPAELRTKSATTLGDLMESHYDRVMSSETLEQAEHHDYRWRVATDMMFSSPRSRHLAATMRAFGTEVMLEWKRQNGGEE